MLVCLCSMIVLLVYQTVLRLQAKPTAACGEVRWDPHDGCLIHAAKNRDGNNGIMDVFCHHLFGGTSLSMITVSCFIYQKSKLQICPLYRFSETKPQMVLVPRDVNIGFQGLAALIQGQIYNPERVSR